jgi:hypothetical protein
MPGSKPGALPLGDTPIQKILEVYFDECDAQCQLDKRNLNRKNSPPILE